MCSDPPASERTPAERGPDKPTPDQQGPIGPGRVVLIVGPSGSGKDTLLRRARVLIDGDRDPGTGAAADPVSPPVRFPGRVVTRVSDVAEEQAMTVDAFAIAEAAGAFALTWRAHGLAYGVPRAIDDAVIAGDTVVVNASRTVVAAARRRYAHVTVVLIDAPDEMRAARVADRARDSDGAGTTDVASRLARAPSGFSAEDADVVIANVGTVEAGAGALHDVVCGRGGPADRRAQMPANRSEEK